MNQFTQGLQLVSSPSTDVEWSLLFCLVLEEQEAKETGVSGPFSDFLVMSGLLQHKAALEAQGNFTFVPSRYRKVFYNMLCLEARCLRDRQMPQVCL